MPSTRVTSDDSVKAAFAAMRHSGAAQLRDSSLRLRNDKNLQCGNSVDTSQHQQASIFARLGTRAPLADLSFGHRNISVRQRRNNLIGRVKPQWAAPQDCEGSPSPSREANIILIYTDTVSLTVNDMVNKVSLFMKIEKSYLFNWENATDEWLKVSACFKQMDLSKVSSQQV